MTNSYMLMEFFHDLSCNLLNFKFPIFIVYNLRTASDYYLLMRTLNVRCHVKSDTQKLTILI